MEDTARTPLLPPGGTGPNISSSSEASSHDAGCSKFLPQEGQERDANQAAPRDVKKTEDTSELQGSSSGTRETPPGSDRTDLGDHSGQIPAAADNTQGAVTNKFFPSPRFPFFLRKTPAEMAAAGGETPLHRDCAALVKRLEDLERLSGGSSVIADPTARLIEATRSLALTDGVDSKESKKSQFEMILASMSLTMVASREKIEEEIATTAKNLASEAAALLPKTGGLEQQQTGRSNDFLLCLTISGSLALLPYLLTQIPEWLRPYIGGGFALVFYAASVGAILSFRATRRSHLKFADFLSTVSFAGFSLLVIAFIWSALSSGNVLLLVICALLLLAGQLYAWRW